MLTIRYDLFHQLSSEMQQLVCKALLTCTTPLSFFYMRHSSLILGCLVLGLPIAGQAQSTDVAPTPRFYVGIGLYSSYYNRLGNPYNLGTAVPVQATLGYQLRPRLAVQASLAYSGNSGHNAGTLTDYATGNTGEYFSNYRNRFFTLAVQGRYALLRQTAHRLQLDAVGGATIERHTYHGDGAQPNFLSPNPGTTTSFDRSSSNNVYLVSLGPSVRFRLASRVEAVGDWLLNVDTRAAEHPNSSFALGLRYRFGGLR